MPRKRQEALREATFEDIKAAARTLMGEKGTAGLSMRGIARQLDLTAPALYYYYGSLDDLITALIYEDYHALADVMEAARESSRAQSPADQLTFVLNAYRQWALDHPVDFMLISGNPIPGYDAPGELTTPAAARVLAVPTDVIADGLAAGEFKLPPEALDLPESIAYALQQVAAERGYNTPVGAVYLAVSGWTQINGLVSLELYNATQPVVGDTGAFFAHRMQALIDSMR
ncbi:MAG: TetR/AcrR family transcriptional regulator [Anaerolineae bacterium]|nr:TetR/AcrR family transcriptional regulator [Anaerolineae bacterium]